MAAAHWQRPRPAGLAGRGAEQSQPTPRAKAVFRALTRKEGAPSELGSVTFSEPPGPVTGTPRVTDGGRPRPAAQPCPLCVAPACLRVGQNCGRRAQPRGLAACRGDGPPPGASGCPASSLTCRVSGKSRRVQAAADLADRGLNDAD